MPTTDTPHVPILAQRDAEPDRCAVYRALVERWLQGPTITTPDGVVRNRTNALLASLLDYPPQKVSNWKTGDHGHTPPWWVLMWLAHEVRAEVLMTPDGLGVCWLD